MRFNLKRFTIAVLPFACLSLLLTGLLAGCGDYSGGGGASASTQTISGVASKGPIKDAVVIVWQLVNGKKGAKLGEGRSLSDGSYSIRIPGSSGPVLLEVVGNATATYQDENNPAGPRVPFGTGQGFRAAVPDIALVETVAVTPFTEAAVKIATQTDGSLSTADIKSANAAVSSLLGLDIVETQPNNVAANQVGDLNNSQDKYGVYLAGVQRQIEQESKTVTQIIDSLATPIKDDVPLGDAGANFLAAVNAVILNPDVNPTGVTRLADTTIQEAITKAVPIPDATDTTPPAVPAGLSATLANNKVIKLAWSASAGSDTAGYILLRDGEMLAEVPGLEFYDSTGVPGTSYSYTVRAFDAVRNLSAAGNPANITLPAPPTTQVDAVPPTSPLGLSVSSLGVSTVSLTWNASSDNVGVAGYVIIRDSQKIATVGSPGYTDSQLTANSLYRYQVQAFDAAGNASAAGNEVTAVTLPIPTPADVTPPTQPQGLTAVVGTDFVNLSWAAATDNVGVVGYRIYRDSQLLDEVAVPGYSDCRVVANTTYSYSVVAFDKPGNVSNASVLPTSTDPLPTTPTKDTQAPSVPAGLVSPNFTHNSVNLAWNVSTDNDAVAGYDVYRGGVKIATVAQPGYSDAALAAHTLYAYKVKAFDRTGNASDYSTELSVTTLPEPVLTDTEAPTSPTNLTVFDRTSSSITLTWTAATDNVGVAKYDIYRNNFFVASVSAVGFTDAIGLAPDTTYSYKIKAFDATGNASAFSAELSATTHPSSDASAPTAPALVTAADVTGTSLALSWSASTDNIAVAGYNIYRDGVKVGATAGTLRSYNDTGLTQGSTYKYKIQAFDAAGNVSPFSPELTVDTRTTIVVSVGGQLGTGITEAPSLDVTPPTAPTNLSALTFSTSASQSSVVLTWSASTDNVGVTGYDVYKDGVKIATVTQLGYTVTGVPSGTPAVYYVVAFDAAGKRSVAGSQLTVTPNQASLGVTVGGQIGSGIIDSPSLDVTAPTAPGSLQATTFATSASQSSVVLTWGASTDNVAVAGYEVYKGGVKIATVTQLGYTVTGVASGTPATYFVLAYDVAGNRSTASAPLSVTPNQASLGVTVSGQLGTGITGAPSLDVTAPTAPGNLWATTFAISATQSSVVLTWDASTDNVGVTGYEIYKNGVKLAAVTQPGYMLTGVASGTPASYFIIAFDAAGNRSIAGAPLTVTPNQSSLGVTVSGQLGGGIIGAPSLDVTAPSAPGNLLATTFATSATQSSVVLTWDAATDNVGVAGYDVYRGTVKLATVAQTGYTVTGAASGTPATYSIVAFDAAGNRSVAGIPLTVTPNQVSLGVTVSGQLGSAIVDSPSL